MSEVPLYQGSGLSEEQEFLKGQIEAADYASSLAKFFCALLDMHTLLPTPYTLQPTPHTLRTRV